MIKFFRHIRKSLLMENKTSKPALPAGRYFKYAIGEIVLVVIGILIALQINSWNQNRLDTIEAKKLTKSIYNDIVRDTLLLTNHIKENEDLLAYNTILLNKLKNDNATIHTFKKVAEDFKPNFWNLESFNNTTLNSIESSGKIDLLEDDLKIKLLEYKIAQNECLSKINMEIYLNRINDFSSLYNFGRDESKFLKKLNENIVDVRRYANNLNSLVGYKNFMMKGYISSSKKALKKARLLIDYINNLSYD